MRQDEICALIRMAYYRFRSLMLARAWQSLGFGAFIRALGLLLVGATKAHAHGLPPSAFGIVASSSEKPTLVVLNEGLAVARPDGWSFLCPSLWGDGDTASGKAPLALSIDGITSFIVGADDLYIARDGVLSAARFLDLSGAAVIVQALALDALPRFVF